MKRKLTKIALVALTIGLLGSCSKINERLDNLDKRVDGLENEQIASINSQITSISSSIADLGQIRSDITSLKQSAENHGQDISALQDAEETLRNRILTLENYLDDVLPTFAETEWVEATFSTLEQYEATCDDIAKLDAKLGTTSEKLSNDIKACADSLTKWVNKTFEGYYTAAQLDAKLGQMKTEIDSAKAAGKITDAKADSIATELTNAKAAVDTAKAAIRAEYRAAIDTAIKASEGKLTKELTDAISEVNGKIESLTTRVGNLETSVNNLLGRVIALEEMIQSVVIVPAYSDGSVEAINGIVELNLIVSPSSAVEGLTKEKVNILLNTVATKAVSVDTVKADKITFFTFDDTKGTVEIKANISDKINALQSKQLLTIAVNVTNGDLSDFTTEFVGVTVVKALTFKAVYNTNGGANTLTFYYDDVDHSGEGITVYDNLPTAATKAADWGYNDNGKRGEIKSVVIDASVAGYKGLTSTAYMFQGMATATNISGAEYLDVSNVTDMSFMFNNFGGGKSGSPTTLNVVPDVSQWNTGNVTNMTAMFESYGNFSSSLDKVPDVSGWNTGKVENMQQMFYEYGNASTNISCVLDLSEWDLSKITETHGEKVFKFKPKTFNVTIPAKTGEKSNEGGKWYYGDGTNSIAPPEGKTFTPASTISTIADVLATAGDNAPSAANHWNDTKGNYIYVDGGNLLVYVSSASSSASVPLDRTVTPNGDNYLYSYGILSFTFNMTEGVLTSIYVDLDAFGVNGTFSPAGTLEYVEIGGVKWATKNLGAEKVTDYGDYFAWGTTVKAYSAVDYSKTTDAFTFVSSNPYGDIYKAGPWNATNGFAWINTPFTNGVYFPTNKKVFTKYVPESKKDTHGNGGNFFDNKKVLDPDDDVAHKVLGGNWRMPTKEEFDALCALTTKSWQTDYNGSGVNGYLFTDANGNSIFLPAAGYGSSTELSGIGRGGSYWSSSLDTDSPISAYCLDFLDDYGAYTDSNNRYRGRSVRPVK